MDNEKRDKRHYSYLVSDDDKNGAYTANQGVTLPEGIGATYNGGLSPLFISRSGEVTVEQGAATVRGHDNRTWSNVVYSSTWSSWLAFGRNTVWPSQHNTRAWGHSLRCLVSTNNRIIIK